MATRALIVNVLASATITDVLTPIRDIVHKAFSGGGVYPAAGPYTGYGVINDSMAEANRFIAKTNTRGSAYGDEELCVEVAISNNKLTTHLWEELAVAKSINAPTFSNDMGLFGSTNAKYVVGDLSHTEVPISTHRIAGNISFTIDAFVRFPTASGDAIVVANLGDGTSTLGAIFGFEGATKRIALRINNTLYTNGASPALAINTNYWVRWTYNAGTDLHSLYVDGVLHHSFTLDYSNYYDKLFIGSGPATFRGSCFIKEFRVTPGVVRTDSAIPSATLPRDVGGDADFASVSVILSFSGTATSPLTYTTDYFKYPAGGVGKKSSYQTGTTPDRGVGNTLYFGESFAIYVGADRGFVWHTVKSSLGTQDVCGVLGYDRNSWDTVDLSTTPNKTQRAGRITNESGATLTHAVFAGMISGAQTYVKVLTPTKIAADSSLIAHHALPLASTFLGYLGAYGLNPAVHGIYPIRELGYCYAYNTDNIRSSQYVKHPYGALGNTADAPYVEYQFGKIMGITLCRGFVASETVFPDVLAPEWIAFPRATWATQAASDNTACFGWALPTLVNAPV